MHSLQAQTNSVPQTNGIAVLGDAIIQGVVVDQELNYFMFLERVQHPWTIFMAGNGGDVPYEGYATGLGWDPYKGPSVVTKAANPPYQFQIGMYMGSDLTSAYYAATNGMAVFEPLFLQNTYMRTDLRTGGEILGNGPPTWMTVAAGFSTSTNAMLVWGPQLEFIDAVRDITDPSPNVAMSFCANCTAARYANLKFSRTNWNVFDLRQGLRQASTFYNSNGWGWSEQVGYGFPRVPNQVGDSFGPPNVPTNREALDGGPPLQGHVLGKAGLNGPQLVFSWYNFRQSTFDHTRLKVGNTVLEAPGSASSYVWDVGALWPPPATNAQFVTVLSGQPERTSPPETYAQAPIPPILAQPQFGSDTVFQFTIYAFPCTAPPDNPVSIYASTDLVSWTFLQTVWLPKGIGAFTDTSIGPLSCRFYRVVQGGVQSQILGFTRTTVGPGKSALIANQLDRGDDSLATIFSASTIASSITVTKQNPQQSTSYDLSSGGWSDSSPKLWLSPGEAAWLYNPGPADCVVRFVGDVREGALLNWVPANGAIVSFMVPIPFSSYLNFQRNFFSSDPLGSGTTVRRWDGSQFVSYYCDPQQNSWVPTTPPIQPGEGFTVSPGFPIATNQPAPWTMAFSSATPDVVLLYITSVQVSAADVLISFTTTAGQSYQVQYTDDPTLSTWNSAVDSVAGTGDIVSAVHSGGATSTARFYRIRHL